MAHHQPKTFYFVIIAVCYACVVTVSATTKVTRWMNESERNLCTRCVCIVGMYMNCTYLSIITGSDGVSFRFPQLFLSQHRLFVARRKRMQRNHRIYYLNEVDLTFIFNNNNTCNWIKLVEWHFFSVLFAFINPNRGYRTSMEALYTK